MQSHFRHKRSCNFNHPTPTRCDSTPAGPSLGFRCWLRFLPHAPYVLVVPWTLGTLAARSSAWALEVLQRCNTLDIWKITSKITRWKGLSGNGPGKDQEGFCLTKNWKVSWQVMTSRTTSHSEVWRSQWWISMSPKSIHLHPTETKYKVQSVGDCNKQKGHP